jgi:hypothetical protein
MFPRSDGGGEHCAILASLIERCKLQIPIEAGRVFRRDAGQHSDLKPATIPN